MLKALRSRLARVIAPNSARRFDAASFGSRWSGTPHFGPIGPEVLTAAGPVRSRARYFYANNPWAASGIAALAVALVGAGIMPASKLQNADAKKQANTHFARWSRRADADGLTDFSGLQTAIATALAVDGESFVQIIPTTEGPKLRLIPAEMVDPAYTMELANGARIVAGVEFDATGRRVAYHVSPVRPTDTYSNYAQPVRVSADDMLHIFRPLGAGQVRGISWLAPVLLILGEFDQLSDAQLVGAKIAAMHAGFLVDTNGTATGNPYDGTQKGSVLENGLEPGTLKYVPPGFDIKFSTPQQASQLVEFGKVQLRAIAAGLGVPEHLMTGDLTGANYSSLRAGLVAFRQRVEQIQFNVLVPQLLQPVWERVISFGFLSGVLPVDAEASEMLEAEWYPPAQPWVDPMKDAQAEILLVSNGLKSRRQAVAAQGFSVDDLDAEIAADKKREESLGLSFGVQSPPAQNDSNNPNKQEPPTNDA
jgi:lambda family phage portal protein